MDGSSAAKQALTIDLAIHHRDMLRALLKVKSAKQRDKPTAYVSHAIYELHDMANGPLESMIHCIKTTLQMCRNPGDKIDGEGRPQGWSCGMTASLVVFVVTS